MMGYNSNSYIFIITLLVCDLAVALDRTCTDPGYYACADTWGCCPNGYDCTATKCTKPHYYHASTSDSSASNVWQIIGYCISGLVGLFFLAVFFVACCAKCKQSCERPGQVGAMDTQTGGQNRAAMAIRY